MSSTPTSAPLIGVPCGLHYPPESPARPLHTMRESYLHALVQAGAMPLILPLIEDEEKLRTGYERLDGLLLAGGGDIDPAMYGEPRHPATGNVQPRRDGVEATLSRGSR